MAAIVLAFAGLVAVAHASPISLGVGDSAFWEGTASTDVTKYELRVARGGHRLRVAVDHPGTTDSFSIRLRSPDGTTVPAPGTGIEAFAMWPDPGIWEVLVVRNDPAAGPFG